MKTLTEIRIKRIARIIALSWFLLMLCFAVRMLFLKQPETSANCPPELLHMVSCFANFSKERIAQDGLMEYRPEPFNLKFFFENQIISVEHNWYGETASLEIDGTRRFPGIPDTTKRTWSDSIMVTGRHISSGDPKPSFRVSVKLTPNDIHRTLRMNATMDIIYPQSQSKGFVNVGKHVEKVFSVFVVTPEEFKFGSQYHDWVNRYHLFGGLIMSGFLGFLLALFAGWWITNVGKP